MHFLITFAHERPRWGGRGTRVSAHPPWKSICIWGILFSLLWGFFLHVDGFFFLFWGSFAICGGLFSTYVEKFLGLSPLTKIFAGAHALVARVVANTCILLWKILKEIVRLNLLTHFGAHFHIMLRKSMKYTEFLKKNSDSCIFWKWLFLEVNL